MQNIVITNIYNITRKHEIDFKKAQPIFVQAKIDINIIGLLRFDTIQKFAGDSTSGSDI